MATPPSSIITMAMTLERTGLSMKNRENIRSVLGLPYLAGWDCRLA
jgi:hypothetical protein